MHTGGLVGTQQVLHRCVLVSYLVLVRMFEDKELANLLFLSLFRMTENSPNVFIKLLMIHCI